MTGLNIGTGTYFGSGVVSAGSGYSGSAYSQTVTSAKLNQMSRNAAANYSLQMETIQNYLEKNGKLFLVIRKEQGAKSLIVDLEKIYTVTILEKKKGFFILECSC